MNYFFCGLLQLESWFQRGAKKGIVPRPGSQSMSRPTSETDFGEIDDNDLKLYEREINAMDEKQLNQKFEDLLVSEYFLEKFTTIFRLLCVFRMT